MPILSGLVICKPLRINVLRPRLDVSGADPTIRVLALFE